MSDNWAERRLSFGPAAAAYASGRPSYPLDAVQWALPHDAPRDKSTTVLDLAAGTGKLTDRLLELGVTVRAVEPLADMRAYIPADAHAVDGTAEAIPLPDASVDAITVGQAYHWFDPQPALAEMTRVLKENGTIGLFWNALDDSVPWVATLADIIGAEERASNIAADPHPVWADAAGLDDPVRRMFTHAPAYDEDQLLAFVVSRSQAILMPADERADMLDRVRAIVPVGEFPLPLVCEAWRGERHQRP